MGCGAACASVMRVFLFAVLLAACTGLHRERRTIGIVFRGLVDAHTRTTPKPQDPRVEKQRQAPPATVYLIPIKDRKTEEQLFHAAQTLRQNATRNLQLMATDKMLENPLPIIASNDTEISRRNSSQTEPKQFFIRIRGDEGKSIMIKITGDDVKVKKEIDSYMIGVNTQDTKSNIKIELPDKKGNRFEQINPYYIPLHPNVIPTENTKKKKSKESAEDQETKEGYHLNRGPFAIPFSTYPYSLYQSQPTIIPPQYPSAGAYPNIAVYPSVAAYPLHHPGFPYSPHKPAETQTKEPPKAHVQLTVRVKDETKHSDSHPKESQTSQQTTLPQQTLSQQQSKSPSQGYLYEQPKSLNPVKYTGPTSIGYQDSSTQQYSNWYLQPPQSQTSNTASSQQSSLQNWNYAQYSPYSQYLQPPQPQTAQQPAYHQTSQTSAYRQATQQPDYNLASHQYAYNQAIQYPAYDQAATHQPAYSQVSQQPAYHQASWNYAQYSPYSSYLQHPQQDHTSASQHWNYAHYRPYHSYHHDTVAPPYPGYRFQRSLPKTQHKAKDTDDCFLCSLFLK